MPDKQHMRNLPQNLLTIEEMPANLLKDVEVFGVEKWGVFRAVTVDGRVIIMASLNDYNTLITFLHDSVGDLDGVDYIVTPELFTTRDIPFHQIPYHREQIENRIETVLDKSKSINTTILLGTPYWFEQEEKPRNCLLYIRRGEVVNVEYKKVNADTEEFALFEFKPVRDLAKNMQPSRTKTLICAELGIASVFPSDRFSLGDERVRYMFAKGKPQENWVRFYTKQDLVLIPADVKTLIVSSMWGVAGDTQNFEPQGYYRMNLFAVVNRVFKKYPNLKDIIFCDSTVPYPENEAGGVSSHPYNYHFQRKQV